MAYGHTRGTRWGGRLVGLVMVGLSIFALVVFLLPFAFPTPPPIVTRFGATQLFSPQGDGARDVARVSVRMRERGTVTLEVTSGDRVVRTLARDLPTRRGWLRLTWDGLGDDGVRVPDGEFSLRLRARSGRKVFNTSRRIRVDTTGPALRALTVTPGAYAATGPVAECTVDVTPADDAAVTLDVRGAAGPVDGDGVRRLGPRPVEGGDTLRWAWDGRNRAGDPVRPGMYVLRATLQDAARNSVTTERTCWVGQLIGALRSPDPRPGDLVAVLLRRPDGTNPDPRSRVRLQLYRRVGTPGEDRRVLGRRVARPVTTTAADAAIRLPSTRRTDALWLVAQTSRGRALISLGDGG